MKTIQKIKMVSPSGYDLRHEIKEDEENYIVTVKLKLKKNNFGNKIIDKCFKKQISPITQILSDKEKEIKSYIKNDKSYIPFYTKI